MEWNVKPVAFLKSCFVDKNGTPRQGNLVASSRGSLTISKEIFNNPEHSLDGLSAYSHVWLIFVFHQNTEFHHAKAKIAPPRYGGERVGVFSTRSPHRPNSIGLSMVRLESIRGSTLFVSGVDIVDGTPILDIKPYIRDYDSPQDGPDCEEMSRRTPCHVSESVTAGQKSSVLFTPRAERSLSRFSRDADADEYRLEFLESSNEARSAIEKILLEDPRSVYRRERCCDRLYYFSLDRIHVTCWFDEDDDVFEVVRVKPRNRSLVCGDEARMPAREDLP